MLAGFFHNNPKSLIQDDVFGHYWIFSQGFFLSSYYNPHIFYFGTALIDVQLHFLQDNGNHVALQLIVGKLQPLELRQYSHSVELYAWHFELVDGCQRTSSIFLQGYHFCNSLIDCNLFRCFDEKEQILPFSVRDMYCKVVLTFVLMPNHLFLLVMAAGMERSSWLAIEKKLFIFPEVKFDFEGDGLAEVCVGDDICGGQLEIDFSDGCIWKLFLHGGIDLIDCCWSVACLDVEAVFRDVVELEGTEVEVADGGQDVRILSQKLNFVQFEGSFEIVPSQGKGASPNNIT